MLYDHQVFDEDKDSLLSKDEFTKMYIRRQESVLLAGKVGEDPILEVRLSKKGKILKELCK